MCARGAGVPGCLGDRPIRLLTRSVEVAVQSMLRVDL